MWNVSFNSAKTTTKSGNQSLKDIACIDICLDQTMIAMGSYNDEIHIWSSQEKKVIKIFRTDKRPESIAFLSNNQQLAILDNENNCYIWNIQSDEKTVVSLSAIPNNLNYNGIKYENNELQLITSDKKREYTYRWAISSSQKSVKLEQENYIYHNPYSQNVIKTSDNYEIKVDSEYRLLVSLTQDSQKCIQALEIPQNHFNQKRPYLACCFNLVLVWKYYEDIIIVDISNIKEQLMSM